jgi:hypothetical protein
VNFDEKVLVLENRIIDFLTMLTWWTEVRWNKNNLKIAFSFMAFGGCLAGAASGYMAIDSIEKKSWVIAVIFSIVLTLETVKFFVCLFFEERVLQRIKKFYPQGFPNPCRVSKKHSNRRRIAFFAIILIFFVSNATMWLLSDFCLAGYFLFGMISEFLLACDSLPPEEKAKRRARNEIVSMLPEGSLG